MSEPDRVSAAEAKSRLDAGEPVVFLDTRADDAWRKADWQIPGSRRVPPDAVERCLHEIPPGRPIVTYCT
jgi:rhodanese-related sulfurtransferase